MVVAVLRVDLEVFLLQAQLRVRRQSPAPLAVGSVGKGVGESAGGSGSVYLLLWAQAMQNHAQGHERPQKTQVQTCLLPPGFLSWALSRYSDGMPGSGVKSMILIRKAKKEREGD